jgi:AmiR/NasT family two-component response regulator
MRQPGTEHLRILVASRRQDRAESTATRVAALGHDVIAGETDLLEAGTVAAGEWPELVLVEVGRGSTQALEVVAQVAGSATCPVIIVTDEADPALAREAAARGAFACVTHREPELWQAAIEIARRRFADYRRLATAFERRAVIERAKGILMERHSVDERRAFEVLRSHARDANQRLVDVAASILDGHALLPRS